MYDIPSDLEALVRYLTKDYDESHDINHHLAVYSNCIKIYEEIINDKSIDLSDTFLDKYFFNIIKFSALLHDTIDYKYPFADVKKIIVKSFLEANYADYAVDVLTIINNISYSSEIKKGYPNLGDKNIQLVRDIVSDADKLEAIGEIGVKRCIEFGKQSHPTYTDEQIMSLVIVHSKEKLIRLKDEFIRTKPAKKLAEEPHKVILKLIS